MRLANTIKEKEKLELFDAIKTRRSIRRYTDATVDDNAVEKILDAGRWAPSWANTQCCRFVVVRDPAIKSQIADSLIAVVKKADQAMDNPGKEAVNTVPVLIVVCAEMNKSGCSHGNTEFVTDKGDWFMFDAALAVQNMVLAAHGLGLGTVIIGAFDAPQVEKILGVPDGYRVVTLVPVGVPAREGKAPPRNELSDITLKDKWG